MTRPEGFLARKRARRLETLETAPPPLAEIRARARDTAPPLPFAEALLSGESVALIAEFKRRSPSAGELCAEEPDEVARLYAAEGARALSVLTDADDFGALPGDLRRAAAAGLPVLRKDFLISPVEIVEARAEGAAAVLLIVGMLEDHELVALVEAAGEWGLDALVEVHDAAELQRALAAGATLVGINNRDLSTLETHTGTTERLAWAVPGGVTLVAESGISTPDDVRRMRAVGAHAVLVGEAFLRLEPAQRRERVRALAGVRR
jgi:indole-3-glycerol phosphate synthase